MTDFTNPWRNAWVIDILDAIAAVPGKKDKAEIIALAMENPEFVLTAEAALNPHLTYNIRKIPDFKMPTANSSAVALSVAIRRLKTTFASGMVRGNAAELALIAMLENLYPKDVEVIIRILQRDLKCGASVSSMNKAKKGLIPVYPVLLASPGKKANRERIKFPAVAQIKVDGLRGNIIVNGHNLTIKSRSGKLLDMQGYYDFMKGNGKFAFMLDGEFIVVDDRNVPIDRARGNGLLRKYVNGRLKEKINIVFICWDIVPLKDFENASCPIPYYDRWNSLIDLSRMHHMVPNRFRIVENRQVHNDDQITDFYQEARHRGEEGLVIKNTNHLWKNGRSRDVVKMKAEEENEMIITGIYEGEGEREGRLGGFFVESADGRIKCRCGSGLTKQQTIDYWTKDMIGKIVTVKYNEVIQNSAGDTSLFLPIFVEVRDDKDEADSYEAFV